jgi:cell division protein FtsQ
MAPRRDGWLRWAIVPAVAAGLAAAGLLLIRSPLFAVDEVLVTGEERLTEAQVLRIAGLTGRPNVFSVDPEEIAGRLEADPRIARASVTTSLPGTVAIAIEELAPVAAVARGDAWTLIAGDGSVLGIATRRPALPVVDPGRISLGAVAGPVSGCARSLAAIPDELRRRVRLASVRADGSIVLSLRGGVRVLWGPPSRLPEKATALSAVLGWIADERLDVVSVDVRYPGAPAVRLAGGSTRVP